MSNRMLDDASRLDRAFRTRLWVSFAASVVAFATVATVAAGLIETLSQKFRMQAVVTTAVEDLRSDISRTADLVIRAASTDGRGRDRLLLLASSGRAEIVGDLEAIRTGGIVAQASAAAPSQIEALADRASPLARMEREYLTLHDALADARDPGLREMLTARMRDFVSTTVPRALRNVVDVEVRATGTVLDRSENTALALGAFVLALLVLQVPLTYLPLSRAMLRRAEDLVRANEEVQASTMVDRVTGLATRAKLVIEGSELLANPEFNGKVCFAVIDIDRFREVNDTLGWPAGDTYLATVARTLSGLAGPDDLVARVGADDFVFMKTSRTGEIDAEALAETLKGAISQEITVEGERLTMSCFVGLAEAEPGGDLETALMDADMALDDAWRGGPGKHVVFTSALRKKMNDRRNTIEGLRDALATDRIIPFFQPQIAGGDGAISGFEALVRWDHPERGILTPWHFLDAAEGAGMLHDITWIMIRKSLAQMAWWHARGYDVPQIGLNFAASDLRGSGFIDNLKLEVDRFGLEPRNVCIELLETAMIEDERDPIIKTLADLSAAGFPVELDDFGTGHSSLSNLAKIKVDGMKIDRSFVTNMNENESQQKLTRSMLGLAQSLDIESLAEGVETEEERDLLVAMGCHKLQGYGIAKPMSAADATKWMHDYIAKLPERKFVGIDLADGSGADEHKASA